jgi:SmpA / OmlA family
MGILATLLGLVGCDPQRISELEEGVSTEADVRARFGEPEKVWDGPGGARVFEYNRQPAGHQNYMISIGTDGKMASLRQVLTPENFARVQPGMTMEDVRRQLGKPMKITPYDLKKEVAYDWRFMEPPNTSKVFTVTFNTDYRVLRTASAPDPESPENRGGPSN